MFDCRGRSDEINCLHVVVGSVVVLDVVDIFVGSIFSSGAWDVDGIRGVGR